MLKFFLNIWEGDILYSIFTVLVDVAAVTNNPWISAAYNTTKIYFLWYMSLVAGHHGSDPHAYSFQDSGWKNSPHLEHAILVGDMTAGRLAETSKAF